MPWHGRFVGEEKGRERKTKADPSPGSAAWRWRGGRPALRTQASQGHFLLLCPALAGLRDPGCDRKPAGERVGGLYQAQAVVQPGTPCVSARHPSQFSPAPLAPLSLPSWRGSAAAFSAACPRAAEVLPQRIPRGSDERARKEFGKKLSL